jgi:hypothetical protein
MESSSRSVHDKPGPTVPRILLDVLAASILSFISAFIFISNIFDIKYGRLSIFRKNYFAIFFFSPNFFVL